MVRDEILGGLKSALERGHSLERAMISMFNAGYKRKEIEEAAIVLLEKSKSSGQIQEPGKIKLPPDVTTQIRAKASPELQVSAAGVPIPPQTIPAQQQIPLEIQKPVQKVSDYEKQGTKKKKDMGVILILILLLIFLIGMFGAIFVYRQQVVDFLNSLFS